MAEADIFRPKQRVELLDGEVLEMSPIGARPAACVNRLAFLFMSQLGERGMVLALARGVPEVWVVDLVTDTLHVTRGGQAVHMRVGDSVAPFAFPDLVLEVAAILGAPR